MMARVCPSVRSIDPAGMSSPRSAGLHELPSGLQRSSPDPPPNARETSTILPAHAASAYSDGPRWDRDKMNTTSPMNAATPSATPKRPRCPSRSLHDFDSAETVSSFLGSDFFDSFVESFGE